MSAEDCLSLIEQPEWFEEAACRGMDPNVFFPNVQETVEQDRAIAKRVCSNCSVRELCEIRGRFEEYGIWGGTDEDQRHESGDIVLRSQQRGFWADE